MTNRIAFKLVMLLVFFSLILTFLGTLVQLRSEYLGELELVRTSMDKAVAGHKLELSKYIAGDEINAIKKTLYHLVSDTSIDYVSISKNGVLKWEQGAKKYSNDIILAYTLNTEGQPEAEQEVVLKVSVETQPVRDKVRENFTRRLAHNAIYTLFTAGFVFLLFQFMITRHLEKLAQQVSRLDPTKPSSPLKLARRESASKDELQQLVSGVNSMLKKAQENYDSLVKNEERLLLFFDATQEAIIGVDRFGICTFANNASRKLLEIGDAEVLVGKNLHELFQHSSREYGKAGVRLVVLSMEKVQTLHCNNGSIIIPGGKEIHVSLRSYPVCKGNTVTGAVIFIVDNSMARQLRREGQLLDEALGQIPVMIVITDVENRVRYVNPGTERLLGFAKTEMVGKSLYNFYELLGVDTTMHFAEIEKHIRDGKPWDGVVKIQSKYKTELKFYSMFFPVYDEHGKFASTISVSREVTYEIKLQNELVNAKKMEAVGRLSANLAHEFGNPLFGVSSVLKDVKERDSLDSSDAELLELAYSECERLRRMVREFQNLYKSSSTTLEYLSLAEVISSALHQAKPVMRKYNISCELNLIEAAEEMIVSGSKLAMVLNNVIMNGIESMSDSGGRLGISTTLDEDFFTISVSDEGTGIKAEYQELIFEPFFSTKTVVEGAGLGLSIAYGTMKSLGGSISFTSSEGRGSSFHIHMPIRS